MNEIQHALMEGAINSATDEYFTARPQIDTKVNRRVYEDGFKNAWNQMLPMQCDCTTETSADGKKKTFCDSDQMMRHLKTGMFPCGALTTCDMD